eukprot:3110110-Pleurochrysis_carterae.AAC.1
MMKDDSPNVAETPASPATDEEIQAAINEERVETFVNSYLPNVLSREQVIALQKKAIVDCVTSDFGRRAQFVEVPKDG